MNILCWLRGKIGVICPLLVSGFFIRINMKMSDSLYTKFASPKNLKTAFNYINREVKKSRLPLDPFWTPGLSAVDKLDFAVQARYKFATGSISEKRDILATIGSNMILEGKKLRVDAQKPYCFLEEIIKVEPTASAEFEPEKRTENLAQLETLWAENPAVQGRRDSNPQSGFWRPVVCQLTDAPMYSNYINISTLVPMHI